MIRAWAPRRVVADGLESLDFRAYKSLHDSMAGFGGRPFVRFRTVREATPVSSPDRSVSESDSGQPRRMRVTSRGVRIRTTSDAGRRCRPPNEEHLQPALALDLDLPARLDRELPEVWAQPVERRPADLDLPGETVALHPACRVNRVAPQVPGEPLPPDHPSHERAAVDTDPELERQAGLHRVLGRRVEHREPEPDDPRGVIGQGRDRAAGGHVAVADRLHLSETEPVR